MALDSGQKSIVGTIAQVVGMIVVIFSAAHYSGRISSGMEAMQETQKGLISDQRETTKMLESVARSIDRVAIRVDRVERDLANHGARIERVEMRR